MRTRITRRQVFAGLILLGLFGLAAVLLAWQNVVERPLGEGPETVIRVESGSSFAQVATALADRRRGVNAMLLRVYGRLSGIAGRIQVGEYRIRAEESAAELLKRMAEGDVIEYRFTIIEGWRFAEMMAALEREAAIDHTLGADVSGAEVMEAINRPGIHPEGRFLPETYHYTRGTTDVALLRRANRALEDELAAAWQARHGPLPLNDPDEALVLASIIEKETGRAAERRRIAGVFTRRLRKGMRLQTDPTVIYGIGPAFDGNLTREHLRTDTPYNTYTRHGLPPTPIALPGAAAIAAATQPLPGESLYFVSRGDGSHVFSKTLEAHNAAVRRYQLRSGSE